MPKPDDHTPTFGSPNPAILRVVDVNCNRCREAMRVVEDHARLVLNHAVLSEQLKSIRHDFQRATYDLQRVAIPHRDAEHDVGTSITTETERSRQGLTAVVTAACKRLGEALRTVEEYAKTIPGARASDVERLRYRWYDVEKAILATLTPGRARMEQVKLCVLITESACRGRAWDVVARQAIEGGADCLQLREKSLDAGELLARARTMAAMCRDAGVVSIVNDRPDVAMLSGADGVHVGQADLPAAECRKIVGPDKILGVSTHRIEQVRQALIDGADYVGAGPIFPSDTKTKKTLAGLAYARDVASSGIPLTALAISGINASNLQQLLETGLTRIAVTASVTGADDPREAARALKAQLTR
jgi:thiamine-phosphate pyrophosphorylase